MLATASSALASRDREPSNDAACSTDAESDRKLSGDVVCSAVVSSDDEPSNDTRADVKAARKAAKKAAKALKRANRADPSRGQKDCDLCCKSVDLLVRCKIAEDGQWKMVCGKCWNLPVVAGGVTDGDGSNPHYRYGGLWKNLHKNPR